MMFDISSGGGLLSFVLRASLYPHKVLNIPRESARAWKCFWPFDLLSTRSRTTASPRLSSVLLVFSIMLFIIICILYIFFHSWRQLCEGWQEMDKKRHSALFMSNWKWRTGVHWFLRSTRALENATWTPAWASLLPLTSSTRRSKRNDPINATGLINQRFNYLP